MKSDALKTSLLPLMCLVGEPGVDLAFLCLGLMSSIDGMTKISQSVNSKHYFTEHFDSKQSLHYEATKCN